MADITHHEVFEHPGLAVSEKLDLHERVVVDTHGNVCPDLDRQKLEHLGLVEALLLFPGVVHPQLDPLLDVTTHLVLAHVVSNLVHLVLEDTLALACTAHYVPDVADQDGKYEHALQDDVFNE